MLTTHLKSSFVSRAATHEGAGSFATLHSRAWRSPALCGTRPLLESMQKSSAYFPTSEQRDWFNNENVGKSRGKTDFSTNVTETMANKFHPTGGAPLTASPSTSSSASSSDDAAHLDYISRSADSAGKAARQMDSQASAAAIASSISLPNLPGISAEELADKLRQFEVHRQRESENTANVERSRRLKEIDQMRRSLPPKKFKEFMEDLEKMDLKNEAEMEKVAAMSPQELLRYQTNKRWWHNFWTNLNFFFVVFCALGGFLVFYYLLIEFFVV